MNKKQIILLFLAVIFVVALFVLPIYSYETSYSDYVRPETTGPAHTYKTTTVHSFVPLREAFYAGTPNDAFHSALVPFLAVLLIAMFFAQISPSFFGGVLEKTFFHSGRVEEKKKQINATKNQSMLKGLNVFLTIMGAFLLMLHPIYQLLGWILIPKDNSEYVSTEYVLNPYFALYFITRILIVVAFIALAVAFHKLQRAQRSKRLELATHHMEKAQEIEDECRAIAEEGRERKIRDGKLRGYELRIKLSLIPYIASLILGIISLFVPIVTVKKNVPIYDHVDEHTIVSPSVGETIEIHDDCKIIGYETYKASTSISKFVFNISDAPVKVKTEDGWKRTGTEINVLETVYEDIYEEASITFLYVFNHIILPIIFIPMLLVLLIIQLIKYIKTRDTRTIAERYLYRYYILPKSFFDIPILIFSLNAGIILFFSWFIMNGNSYVQMSEVYTVNCTGIVIYFAVFILVSAIIPYLLVGREMYNKILPQRNSFDDRTVYRTATYADRVVSEIESKKTKEQEPETLSVGDDGTQIK